MYWYVYFALFVAILLQWHLSSSISLAPCCYLIHLSPYFSHVLILCSICRFASKRAVVQQYFPSPLLLFGMPFSLRAYVLVTSVAPLRAYLHTEGLVNYRHNYQRNFKKVRRVMQIVLMKTFRIYGWNSRSLSAFLNPVWPLDALKLYKKILLTQYLKNIIELVFILKFPSYQVLSKRWYVTMI